jgi:hypothetical protein
MSRPRFGCRLFRGAAHNTHPHAPTKLNTAQLTELRTSTAPLATSRPFAAQAHALAQVGLLGGSRMPFACKHPARPSLSQPLGWRVCRAITKPHTSQACRANDSRAAQAMHTWLQLLTLGFVACPHAAGAQPCSKDALRCAQAPRGGCKCALEHAVCGRCNNALAH